jgi:hypothetical protein
VIFNFFLGDLLNNEEEPLSQLLVRHNILPFKILKNTKTHSEKSMCIVNVYIKSDLTAGKHLYRFDLV